MVTEDSESIKVSDGYLFKGDEQIQELIKKSADLKTKNSDLTLLQRINGEKQHTPQENNTE